MGIQERKYKYGIYGIIFCLFIKESVSMRYSVVMRAGLFLLCMQAVFESCNYNRNSHGGSTPDSNGVVTNSYDSANNLNETKFSSSQAQQDNAQYLMKGYSSGLYEIKAADEARRRSSVKEVRKLAGLIRETYMGLNRRIESLAIKKQISLPSDLDPEQQDLMNVLRSERGTDFDEDYLRQITNDHKSSLILFDQARKDGDTDVIRWADQTLPAVQKCLDMINACQRKLDSAEKR